VVSPPEFGDIPPPPGDIPRSSDCLPISFWVVASSSSGTADTMLRHQYSDTTASSKSMPQFSLISRARALSLARLDFNDYEFNQSEDADLLLGSY
jgi:hypothetical protein